MGHPALHFILEDLPPNLYENLSLAREAASFTR